MSTILQDYEPLVRSIAERACLSSSVLDFDDLCQIGYIAVLKAHKKKDLSVPGFGNYVRLIVRQAIYKECARFLGVFTVDHRTTKMASNVLKLCDAGKTNEEIADIMDISVDKVQDLKMVYSRNMGEDLRQDIEHKESLSEISVINSLLDCCRTDSDRRLVDERILSSRNVVDLAESLKTSVKNVYQSERELKERITYNIKEGRR